MAIRIIAKVSAPSLGGASNPANVTFAFATPGGTVVQTLAAKVIAYLRYAAFRAGSNSSIDGVAYQELVPGPVIGQIRNLPFPVAEYTAEYQRFRADAQAVISPATSYNVTQSGILSGASGRGTSICITEQPLGPGFAGRHFLPDMSRAVVDVGFGTILDNVRADLVANWLGAFEGQQNSIWEDSAASAEPGIWSSKNFLFAPIASVSCAALPSLLQSRKR